MPKTKSFDAKSFVKEETRSKADSDQSWFVADPEIIYPATIARIKQVLENEELPEELVDHNSRPEIDPRSVARFYLSQAKAISPDAWKWALQDRERFYKKSEIEPRAAALYLARLWFTQALHVQIGGDGTPMGVHWINKPAFRM